jgi:hypothetical protein
MSDSIWKSVIDADLKDADYTPRTPVPDGTYVAQVSNIVAKTFESKSKGVQVTFTITEEGEYRGREINDYYVLQAADGSAGRSGPATLKKLMLACGLTTQEVLKFNYPAIDSKAFGDFKKLLDQGVMLTIRQEMQKKGKNAGKSFARVASFAVAA